MDQAAERVEAQRGSSSNCHEESSKHATDGSTTPNENEAESMKSNPSLDVAKIKPETCNGNNTELVQGEITVVSREEKNNERVRTDSNAGTEDKTTLNVKRRMDEESLDGPQNLPSAQIIGCVQPMIPTPVRDSEKSVASTGSTSNGPPKVIHANIPSLTKAVQGPPTHINENTSSNRPKSKTLRRGKWTIEEEAYVARVIQDFNSGFLDAPAGTTLRSYLSDKLQCDPMRITKKFTGDACIGKRVFHPAVRSIGNASAIDKAQAELDALERRWRRRLEMQQRESAKKAAASAAAVSTSPQGGRFHFVQGVPVALLGVQGVRGQSGTTIQETAVTQAASWLDRANAILGGTTIGGGRTMLPTAASATAPPVTGSEIENQMNEVRRLIYEGPLIQQTTAGLPGMLSYDSNGDIPATNIGSANVNNSIEPADKRQRRTSLSGAEDAEALVGFLRSVRASAASEQDVSN